MIDTVDPICAHCGSEGTVYAEVEIRGSAWRGLRVAWEDGKPTQELGPVEDVEVEDDDVEAYRCSECGKGSHRLVEMLARPGTAEHVCVCGHERHNHSRMGAQGSARYCTVTFCACKAYEQDEGLLPVRQIHPNQLALA